MGSYLSTCEHTCDQDGNAGKAEKSPKLSSLWREKIQGIIVISLLILMRKMDLRNSVSHRSGRLRDLKDSFRNLVSRRSHIVSSNANCLWSVINFHLLSWFDRYFFDGLIFVFHKILQS